MNLVILLGRLGKDPEMSYTQNGTAKCKFSFATSEKWTDSGGQKQEKTEWHNIVIWGRQAEVAGKYLQKGRQVLLEGKNTTRSWDDQQSGQKRYITEVEVKKVTFLSTGDQVQSQQQRQGGQRQTQSQTQGSTQGSLPTGGQMGPDDDDIPF